MTFEYMGDTLFSAHDGSYVIFRRPMYNDWVMHLQGQIFKIGPEDALNCWESEKNKEDLIIDTVAYTQGVL